MGVKPPAFPYSKFVNSSLPRRAIPGSSQSEIISPALPIDITMQAIFFKFHDANIGKNSDRLLYPLTQL